MLLEQLDETMHQHTQSCKAGVHLFLVTAIDELASLFVHDMVNQGELGLGEAALVDVFSAFLNEQGKSFVDKLITGLPGYIGAYHLAVHADLLAADIEVEDLLAGNLPHALPEQVRSVPAVVFHYLLAEKIVSGRGGKIIGQVHQT